jgi:hypothetical protein
MLHRTRAEHAAVAGWVPFDNEWEITVIPVLDRRYVLADGGSVLARPTYNDAIEIAQRYGDDCQLIDPTDLELLRAVGVELDPYFGTPTAEVTLEHSRLHDADVNRQLKAMGWAGDRVVFNAGKHWMHGAEPGWSRLMGWWLDGRWINRDMECHKGGNHHDDGTTIMLKRKRRGERGAERAERSTDLPPDTEPSPMIEVRQLRRGDTGDVVKRMQRVVMSVVDGDFGPNTERRVRIWQEANGLVADGIFGTKSWSVAGYDMPRPPRSAGDPRAAACVAALRDASASYPDRKRQSDGIMGDTRHQFKPGPDGVLGTDDDIAKPLKGHNAGNAVDITHDVDGFDCSAWADLAYSDPRVQYVIFAGRIINKSVQPGIWREYSGTNGHHHHMHVEIMPEKRDDGGPWAWA